MIASGRSIFAAVALLWPVMAEAQTELRNERYRISVAVDGTATMSVAGMTPQTFVPEFTVLWTNTDPVRVRNAIKVGHAPGHLLNTGFSQRWNIP